HVREFLDYAEDPANDIPLEMFVGDIENHDFEFMKPIHHPFNHKLVLTISDFFGYVPTILYHGSEETGRRAGLRSHIPYVDPRGSLGQYSRQLNDQLSHYRVLPGFRQSTFH